jgi:hypothetical protein
MPPKLNDRLTAAQEVLFGAYDLYNQGVKEFSEWDLSVATWKRNPNRFGCRGYEDKYPDHKRVMMEIMSQAKKDNPIRRGLFEKTRPNHYKMTSLGLAEIDHLSSQKDTGEKARKSPQHIYGAVEPYVKQLVFTKYKKDPAEPRMWLGAAAFLGLENSEPLHFEDKLHSARTAIDNGLRYLTDEKLESFRSGVSGGDKAITKDDVLKLKELLGVIEQRFSHQIDAIRKLQK